MTDEERHVAAEALRIAMEDHSERCYAAGWYVGTGPDLWRIAQQGGGSFGMGRITPEQARWLRRCAVMAGGWWTDYRTFVSLDAM